jgi:hypothetical protein
MAEYFPITGSFTDGTAAFMGLIGAVNLATSLSGLQASSTTAHINVGAMRGLKIKTSTEEEWLRRNGMDLTKVAQCWFRITALSFFYHLASQ